MAMPLFRASRRKPGPTVPLPSALKMDPGFRRGAGLEKRHVNMAVPELAVPETRTTPGKPAAKIEIAGLSKVFATRTGPFTALDAISLDITRGNFCTIDRPAGAGRAAEQGRGGGEE